MGKVSRAKLWEDAVGLGGVASVLLDGAVGLGDVILVLEELLL